MIRFEHISKSFNRIKANQNINFSCEPGKISGLLGINGAGKTTALKMLAGLLKPSQGRVTVNGIDAHRDTIAARKNMGILLESNNLYSRLSCKEHIEQFAVLHGLKGNTLKQAINQTAEELDITHLLDRRTEGFSTGEKMKVSLARLLVYQPQYLILDEPTRGLDVFAVRQLREILKRLSAQGCCILFSSHVMQEVEFLCDHLIIIDHGKICRQGNIEQVKQDQPSASLEDTFVSIVCEAPSC